MSANDFVPYYASIDPSIPEPVVGIDAVRQYFGMLENVDMKTKILTIMSKGNDVAAELEVMCTFKRGIEFAGHAAPPSDQSFKVTFAKFYRINAEGLLAEEREYSDTASKFRALGGEAAAEFQSLG